jgi:hypothetical protein
MLPEHPTVKKRANPVRILKKEIGINADGEGMRSRSAGLLFQKSGSGIATPTASRRHQVYGGRHSWEAKLDQTYY